MLSVFLLLAPEGEMRDFIQLGLHMPAICVNQADLIHVEIKPILSNWSARNQADLVHVEIKPLLFQL
jgi:hypothetical protein